MRQLLAQRDPARYHRAMAVWLCKVAFELPKGLRATARVSSTSTRRLIHGACQHLFFVSIGSSLFILVGGFWVSETSGNYVRFVSSSGVLSTVAGVGGATVGTTSTWNGPATSVRLNAPVFIVSDGSGGAYFSHSNLNAIQRILPNNTISTITYAGTGNSGTTG